MSYPGRNDEGHSTPTGARRTARKRRLYRVVQEALHNGVRHSSANHFQVELLEGPETIELWVRDEGIGFDPKTATGTAGLGLISMRARVQPFQGAISIASKPQGGTEIHCRIPLIAGGQ